MSGQRRGGLRSRSIGMLLRRLVRPSLPPDVHVLTMMSLDWSTSIDERESSSSGSRRILLTLLPSSSRHQHSAPFDCRWIVRRALYSLSDLLARVEPPDWIAGTLHQGRRPPRAGHQLLAAYVPPPHT
jgi:hypothetical protein